MESAARADVPADANVLRALAIADAQNLAAQSDVGLEVMDVDVK